MKLILEEVFGEKSNGIIDNMIECLESFDEEEKMRIFLEKLKN